MDTFLTLAGRWQFKLGAAVALLLVGFYGGFRLEHLRWDESLLKTQQAVVDQVIRGAKLNEKVVTQYVTRTKIIHDRIAEEPAYVTPQENDACTVPESFIRMWNDTNAATDPTTGNAANPSDPPRNPGP